MHNVTAHSNLGTHVVNATVFELCDSSSRVEMSSVSYTSKQRMFFYGTDVKNGCVRKARRRFQFKFQKVTVQNDISIHSIVNKLKQTVSLLCQKEPDQNVECSLKRNLMELVVDLNILLETFQTPRAGNWGFVNLSIICHKTRVTEIVAHKTMNSMYNVCCDPREYYL
jgi:hypothetical protein